MTTRPIKQKKTLRVVRRAKPCVDNNETKDSNKAKAQNMDLGDIEPKKAVKLPRLRIIISNSHGTNTAKSKLSG
jgi:hypothetical protein